MTSADLLALAGRVESNPPHPYDLSQEIGQALGMPRRYEHPGSENPSHPSYCTSLDAAMTLVPEGMKELGFHFTLEEDWFDNDLDAWTARFDQRGDECGHGETIMATAETAALAVTAAALRARAATEQGG